MKCTHLSFASVLFVGGIITGSANAALSISPGDLLMGFFKVNSGGTGVEANTVVIDLGPAATYRESFTSLSLGNINADMTTAFGSAWGSDSGIRWGIVGTVDVTDPLTNGDPVRTVYSSKDWGGAMEGSAPTTFSSTQMGSMVTAIKTLSVAMNGVASNGANTIAIVPSSTPSNFSSFLPPVSATNFGVSISPLNSLGSATEGLDLYRALFSTSGADLTTPASPGNAGLRVQQYVGSFTLSSGGDLNFVTPAPEPGTAIALLCSSVLFGRRRRSS